MHRDEVVSVVFIPPPHRRSSVYAQIPPMLSRLSSARVLSPSARQYLHARRPAHPAPTMITSYVSFSVRIASSLFFLRSAAVGNGYERSLGLAPSWHMRRGKSGIDP